MIDDLLHACDALDAPRFWSLAQANGTPPSKLLAEFLSANWSDVDLLRQCVAYGDVKQAEVIWNRIMGASATIGATHITEACSLVAIACRNHDRQGIQPAMAALERSFKALHHYRHRLEPEAPTLAPAVRQEASACHGLRFLVVEDHPFQARLLKLLLRRLGADSVETAEDGASALHAVASRPAFDIAMVDMSLPGMGGMEVLRSFSILAQAPAVIISSALATSALASAIQTARRLPIDFLGAVGKPFSASSLESLLTGYRTVRVQGASGRIRPLPEGVLQALRPG